MLKLLKKLYETLIPHFVTEWVVLSWDEKLQQYVLAFPAEFIEEHETPEYLIKVKSFSIFGFGVFPRLISDKVLYSDYLNKYKG